MMNALESTYWLVMSTKLRLLRSYHWDKPGVVNQDRFLVVAHKLRDEVEHNAHTMSLEFFTASLNQAISVGVYIAN